MENVFQVKDVSFYYKKGMPVLENIQLSCQTGQIIGIVAPNGTGKSTLIDIMAGNLSPQKGEVCLGNLTYKKQFVSMKKQIVKMPDQNDLVAQLTGYDHLLFYAKSWKIPKTKIDELVTTFDMQGFVRKKTKTYSLGMKQRLCFVMTLLTDAPVLLLDEVMNGLDQENTAYVTRFLHQLKQHSKLIVIISHLLDHLDDLCDVVYFIKEKRIYFEFDLKSTVEKIMTVYFATIEKAQAFCQMHFGHDNFRHEQVVDIPSDAITDSIRKQLFTLDDPDIKRVKAGQKSCLFVYQQLYEKG